MTEIEIKYNHLTLEEVIVDLAHHIERGYHISSWSAELSCCHDRDTYTICLVKY